MGLMEMMNLVHSMKGSYTKIYYCEWIHKLKIFLVEISHSGIMQYYCLENINFELGISIFVINYNTKSSGSLARGCRPLGLKPIVGDEIFNFALLLMAYNLGQKTKNF